MSLSSNHHHHSKPLIDPSDMLHLIFGTSFLHHSEFLIRIIHPSQRPSFEHAGFTCYTLLSPSITFHCFTLSSKPTFSENRILHLSLFLSGLISWLRLPDLFAHRFYCFSTIFSVLVIPKCADF